MCPPNSSLGPGWRDTRLDGWSIDMATKGSQDEVCMVMSGTIIPLLMRSWVVPVVSYQHVAFSQRVSS